MKKNMLRHLFFLLFCFGVLNIYAQSVTYQTTHATQDNDGKCQSNGSIDITVDRGFPRYDFRWENDANPGVIIAITEDLNNLADGWYNLTVTDALCGKATLSIRVFCCEKIKVEAEIVDYCDAEHLGSINLTPVDGKTYYYRWSNGAEGSTIKDLTPGKYCVEIIDEGSCRTEYCYEIKSFQDKVHLAYVINSKSCAISEKGEYECDPKFGDGGEINIDVDIPNCSFSWTGPGGFTSFDEDISGLCKGTYYVVVTSPDGCKTNLEATICCCEISFEGGSPTKFEDLLCTKEEGGNRLDVDHKIIPPSSDKAKDGAIDLTVNSALPVSYVWLLPDGSKKYTKDLSSIGVGEYHVTVSNGCDRAERSFTLRVCKDGDIKVDGTTKDACISCNEGSIDLSISGGATPYKFNWSDGVSSQNRSKLAKGSYVVTVTDASECSISKSFTISTQEDKKEYKIKPCRTIYSCNGAICKTENYDQSKLDCTYDKQDCRNQICKCPLNGEDEKTTFVGAAQKDFISFNLNLNECTLFDICFNGGKVKVNQGLINNNISVVQTDLLCNQIGAIKEDNIRKCFECTADPFCNVPGKGKLFLHADVVLSQFFPLKDIPDRVQFSNDNSCKSDQLGVDIYCFCAKTSSGAIIGCDLQPDLETCITTKASPPTVNDDSNDNVLSKYSCIFENMTLLEYFFFLKKTKRIKLDDKLLLPKIFSENIPVKEYFEQIKKMQKEGILEEGFEIKMIEPENEIKQLSCDERNKSSEQPILDNTDKEVTIFPNPTNGLINISFKERNKAILSYTIITLTGKTIEGKILNTQKYNLDLDFSNYPSGIYFIQIIDEIHNRWTKRIIKQ